MTLEEVKKLKREILEGISLARSPHSLGGDFQSDFANLGKKENAKLAVGYSNKGDGLGYVLELRPRNSRTSELSNKIASKIPDGVNIELLSQQPKIIKPVGTVRDNFYKPLCEMSRPIHLGLQITDGHSISTIAGFIEDKDGNTCMLGCYHGMTSMGMVDINAPIYQPGFTQGRTMVSGKGKVAIISDYTKLSIRGINNSDSAAAKLDDGVEVIGNRIPLGYDFLFEGFPIILPPPGFRLEKGSSVYKIGRSTGLTKGIFKAESIDDVLFWDEGNHGVQNKYAFNNVIQVDWIDDEQDFSLPGDSGSLLFCEAPTGKELYALGTLFAAGEITEITGEKRVLTASFFCKIQDVLDELEASWEVDIR